MHWKNAVTQLLSVSSLFVTVNSYVTRLSPDPQNAVDIQSINDRLSYRSIRKFISSPPLPIRRDVKEIPEGLNHDSINKIEASFNKLTKPKRRVKRFTCWHSCLGPWKKKNPKTKEYRYKIKNITPSSNVESETNPDQNETENEVEVPEEEGTHDEGGGETPQEEEEAPPPEPVKNEEDDDEAPPPDPNSFIKVKDEDDGEEKTDKKRNIQPEQEMSVNDEYVSAEEAEGDNAIDLEDENYIDTAAI